MTITAKVIERAKGGEMTPTNNPIAWATLATHAECELGIPPARRINAQSHVPMEINFQGTLISWAKNQANKPVLSTGFDNKLE
jgi:hypothetical protein